MSRSAPLCCAETASNVLAKTENAGFLSTAISSMLDSNLTNLSSKVRQYGCGREADYMREERSTVWILRNLRIFLQACCGAVLCMTGIPAKTPRRLQSWVSMKNRYVNTFWVKAHFQR